MPQTSELAQDITNHIRKIERLQQASAEINAVIANEVKCLHDCLNKGAKLINVKVPEGGVVIQGQPKEDPNPVPEPK